MIFPDIFSVVEPASVKVMTGHASIEIVDLYPVVQSVTVQVSRKQPGVGSIVLTAGRDESGAWPVLDGGYFERDAPIRILADFGGYSEEVLRGRVVKITPEFPADRGAAKATVEFQDESILLDREQVTKTWGESGARNSLSDRTVAQSVLAGYGFSLDPLSAAGQTRTTINQDKTDFRFLGELAEAVGYELRLMFSTLYFGPMRLDGAPQQPILVYAGPDTNCLEFKLDEDAATPESAVAAAVDTAGDGQSAEATLTPDLPILGARPARGEAGAGPRSVWRLRQEGDATPAAARLLAQARINEASLSIKAECRLDSTRYGHVLLPGRLVSVDGVGRRYGGRYYVDSVEHAFDAKGYTQKAVLLKNGVDEG